MAARLDAALALARRLIRQRALPKDTSIVSVGVRGDNIDQSPSHRRRGRRYHGTSCLAAKAASSIYNNDSDTFHDGRLRIRGSQSLLKRSTLASDDRFTSYSCLLRSPPTAIQTRTFSFASLQTREDSSTSAPSHSTTTTDVSDDNPINWTEWFPDEEYGDVWADGLEPLDCPELDKPTRFLISLLNDSLIGVRRGQDKATTARCHRQLERLSDMAIGGKKLEGRAQRADAILRRMEKHLFASASSSDQHSSPSLAALQHKYELPLPDRKTYLMVLRLYAKTTGPAAIAERAEEIVGNMQRAFEELGDISLRPQAVAYNQVISAWASSTEHDKAYRAASVLAKVKEAEVADASSYGHVLRACATSDYTNKSRMAALKIALGLWKDLDSKNEQRHLLTSHFYTFLIRTLGFMSEKKPKERDAAIKKAFVGCKRDGVVNAHVLHCLHLVASKSLYHELLGERLAVQGENAGAAVVAQKVPNSWTRNAMASNSWGW
eukprot:CAMPEP_0178698752 /NCGR_PEP_ID=MMETSP0699-20121125/10699_1 /TAXON_ID=265572 /ORGANISM="Extubocellulus spinifer, Strain CCMP396" /LENGTH=492 /DNA_ID=CAMNT_0020344823 /DNA_START=15 /DNA_END=1490 /DNA_ORIENTATION=-